MCPSIDFDGRQFDVQQDETVLDALLRQGVQVPNSCKAGACQCCMMRAVDGEVPAAAQAGLKPALKEQGYFLSCSCKPAGDLKLESPGQELQFTTSILTLEYLGANVMRVRLTVPEGFAYRPGQFITMFNPEGTARSYSLASLPEDNVLELHIRKIPGGLMSTWIFEQAKPGDRVILAGPAGECFYTDNAVEQPMLLVGTGTGLAPLFGILRDALQRGHCGKIVLYHGALEPNGLYHRTLLGNLAADFANFEYHPCVMRNGDDSVQTGEIDKIVLEAYPSLKGWRGFLCGNPDLVKMLKKKFFLAGMNMKDITTDAFIPSAAPAGPAR
jgi:CDP-4-dehydro-6-deoxyglucose reductase